MYLGLLFCYCLCWVSCRVALKNEMRVSGLSSICFFISCLCMCIVFGKSIGEPANFFEYFVFLQISALLFTDLTDEQQEDTQTPALINAITLFFIAIRILF